jgi:GntR family transcriptional regulator
MPHFSIITPSPVPFYAQIKQSLRAKILDGTYPPHAQLPPDSELSARFEVSRITVRQALNDLQKEGVIFKVAGKGSFVSTPKAAQQLTQLEGFGEAMSRLGYEIYNLVTSLLDVSANAEVAQQLGITPGALVTEITRIRHLNREPVSFEITYVSKDLGERLRKEDLATRDIFLILENDFGVALGRADLQIEAVLADQKLADALLVETGAPILRLQRLTHTTDGVPLDFEYLYFRGDAFQYRLQISRHRAGGTTVEQG